MVNILCSCGEWNEYLNQYKAYTEGYNLYCWNCGKILFDYKKARELEKRDKEKDVYYPP